MTLVCWPDRDSSRRCLLSRRCDVIVSVCPPHAVIDVANSVSGFGGIFVDANAVSPATARAIATTVEGWGGRYVDGGIIGAPPRSPGMTRLYLSGPLGAGCDRPVCRHGRGRADRLRPARGRLRAEDGLRRGRKAPPRCCSRSAPSLTPRELKPRCSMSGVRRYRTCRINPFAPPDQHARRAGAGSGR